MTYDPITGPPSGGASAGAQALMTYALNKWPQLINSGIYNPRDVCGNSWGHKPQCGLSAHLEGRACDFGVRPYRDAVGDEVAQWMSRHSVDFGIQEVIWNRKRWAANTAFWHVYSGRSTHEDHVHVALTRYAAANLTYAKLQEFDTTTPAPDVPPENEEDEMIKILWRSDDGYWAVCGDHMYPIRNGQDLQAHHEAGFIEPASGATADQIKWMRKIYDVDEQRVTVVGFVPPSA